jgi:acyl carrier protein
VSYPHPDLLAGLAEILHEIAGTAPAAVVPEATFLDDLDVDSLSMVEVVVACEERFGVRIPDEALEKMATVQDALDFIAKSGVLA